MFVSPAEPKAFYDLGVVSSEPEKYGVDFMWASKLGTVGIQRKEFPGDFMASRRDGRLVKEFMQMKQLDVPMLLLEGEPKWTLEGELIGNGKRGPRQYVWSKDQHRNFLASVQLRGVQVHSSGSVADSMHLIDKLRLWSNKEDHSSLDRRPEGPTESGLYGEATDADYVRYLYQSFPGVGAKAAGALYSKLGVIFRLTVSEDELLLVPRLRRSTVALMMRMFGGTRVSNNLCGYESPQGGPCMLPENHEGDCYGIDLR